MNPHSHVDLIKSMKEEVKQVPSVPPVIEMGEPLELDDDDDFDIEIELDKLSKMAVVQKEQELVVTKTNEEALQERLLATLWDRKDAPSQEQVAAWKAKHGEHGIQLMSLDPENVFIFTHLTLGQWEKLQKLSEGLQQQPNSNIEKAMKEAVLRQAVLWPKLDKEFFVNCRAGLPTTLYELILMNSYFLSPQQAMTLTTML